MTLEPIITEQDIERVQQFLNEHESPFTEWRRERNIQHEGLCIDKNALAKAIMLCLLTTQQRSGPGKPVNTFLRKTPFPISWEKVLAAPDPHGYIRRILSDNNLNRFTHQIPDFFLRNIQTLKQTNWQLLDQMHDLLKNGNKEKERQLATSISTDKNFPGIGPKQSRNLLQALGLTQYEIPLDSRIIRTLEVHFGFPAPLSPEALRDNNYYNWVLDRIHELCEAANVKPCMLDAAIFSSYDTGGWTKDNVHNFFCD